MVKLIQQVGGREFVKPAGFLCFCSGAPQRL
jgi:hypothetical protein